MQLYSIASGSSGNCIFVGEEDKGILIDVGISMKRVLEGLKVKNLSFEQIQAIFVTHEHTDHICGLGPILRKVPIPVYATADTISAIWEKGNMKNISPDLFHSIRPKEEVAIGDMLVRASHRDAPREYEKYPLRFYPAHADSRLNCRYHAAADTSFGHHPDLHRRRAHDPGGRS